MKSLIVPFLKTEPQTAYPEREIAELELHHIPISPWQHLFPYQPAAAFRIAHNNRSIYLQFEVTEDDIKADHAAINQPVYKDTCVEFFIGFEAENYYNFEFNYIGNILAGYGKKFPDRSILSVDVIKTIQTSYTVDSLSGGGYSWKLQIEIPADIFHGNKKSLTGQSCRLNFYKCGDDLPKPHFLCWNPIDSPEPNFHLPEFFGSAVFG